MEHIGTSSLWEHKYAPTTVKDLILPEKVRKLFTGFVDAGEVDTMLLSGTAGLGKTSSAKALVKDIGSDLLFINGSLENGIDVIRTKVIQFATSNSFGDGGKVVIIDEIDRMQSAQEALKTLSEQMEANCRFIFTTNNLHKIIDPIKSRTKHINFNFPASEKKALVMSYFKRLCFILDTEKVKYDKKLLAEYTQEMFPDFRQTIVRLQLCAKMHGEISSEIFNITDESMFNNLVTEMKNKKFNSVRKLISDIEPDSFYSTFYEKLDELLEPACMPDVIMLLGQFAYESALSVAKEVSLAACCTVIMKEAKWR
jgi:DNA polymerase III delta prime subunit